MKASTKLPPKRSLNGAPYKVKRAPQRELRRQPTTYIPALAYELISQFKQTSSNCGTVHSIIFSSSAQIHSDAVRDSISCKLCWSGQRYRSPLLYRAHIRSR